MDVRVRDLGYVYPTGVEALRGVTLDMASGEAVAIVGQNGAGKTTLVKHFIGLLRPTRGDVRIGDWDTRTKSVAQLAARVGYVFQNPDDQLFSRTVGQEIAFGPRNLGLGESEVRARVAAALETVGLADQVDRHPYDLMQTQRKFVALASVLALDTPVVVLDEPTTGQDAAGVERIGSIVERLQAQGKTVIAISHDIDFCAERFPRVVVMGQGRVLLDGAAGDVLARAEVLAQTYVEPPQLARLALRLGARRAPRNVVEFLQVVREEVPFT